MKLIRQLLIEKKKHKRRHHLVILLGFLLFEMFFLYGNYHDQRNLSDGWMILFYNLPIMNTLFLPVVVSGFASRLTDIEHKGDMLKCLYTFSSRKSIFLTKVVYGLLHIGIFVIAQCAAIFVMAQILQYPLSFSAKYMVYYGISTYLSCSVLFFLHMILSYFFVNQAVSISVGLIGSFVGLFCAYLPNTCFQKMLPWSTFINGMFIGMDWNEETRHITWILYDTKLESVFISILWIVLFGILSTLLLRKTEIEEKEHSYTHNRKTIGVHFHKCPIEILKLKGSPAWFAFFTIPVLSAVLGTLNYLGNLKILTNGWYSLWTQHTLFLCYFFMPVIIAVFAGCIWRIEHQNTNMNLLFAHTSPVKIILDKYIATLFITTLSVVWIALLYILSGLLCHMQNSIPSGIVFWLALGLIGAYAIDAIQLFFALVIRNFVLPIIIAFAGGIAGLICIARDVPYMLPYSLFASGMNSAEMTINLPLFIVCTISFIAVFLVFSIIYLQYTDVRSHE